MLHSVVYSFADQQSLIVEGTLCTCGLGFSHSLLWERKYIFSNQRNHAAIVQMDRTCIDVALCCRVSLQFAKTSITYEASSAEFER